MKLYNKAQQILYPIYYTLLLSVLTSKSIAQTYSSSSEILLQLKKLNTIGSVLYIAAHPDDENTRLLTYLANEKRMRTAYLSLTRGDGGQNLIGKEQGDLLGLIRTQELLAARRIDGAEQYFTRAFDFGFSKNPEETFQFWSKDSILSDIVWVIRNFKPDIIICRFPTTGEGGHGHHTASAILALEAFRAAADVRQFPEQLKHTQVWQAKRIFWNTFNFGGLNTTAENQLKIDVGAYNPLVGKSYGEIAADSRSNHKSQGFGSARGRGEAMEYFKQLGGDTARKDLFEGIDQSWSRFKQTSFLQPLLDRCILQFNPLAPEQSVAQLLDVLQKIRSIRANNEAVLYWQQQKVKELERIIFSCAGLWIEAATSDYRAIPGAPIAISTQIICRNRLQVGIKRIQFSTSDTTVNLLLKHNQLYTFKRNELLAKDHSYSTPYWLQYPHAAGAFDIRDQLLIGRAENNPPLYVRYQITIGDVPFDYAAPVIFKHTDPVRGELYRPLEILPPATINSTESVYMFRNQKPKKLSFLIKANQSDFKGNLRFTAPSGWQIEPKERTLEFKDKGEEQMVHCEVWATDLATDGFLDVQLKVGDIICSSAIKRLDYEHIPPQFTLSDARAKLVRIDVKKVGNNIAYIPGAGDEVPSCLQQIGYKVTTLSVDQIASADLSQFDAIVTGVRAYNTHEQLALQHKKMMHYVKNGGNLIVQYNTNNRISSLPQLIGPYPFVITRDRVTDERAAVRLLQQHHPVFNYPNKITDDDFAMWVQERGIYFASDSLGRYQKLISMNDLNEKASEGSLIVAPYGKGNFVYTGLAFFRQLPAGISGAYRLFANLLSLPPNNENQD